MTIVEPITPIPIESPADGGPMVPGAAPIDWDRTLHAVWQSLTIFDTLVPDVFRDSESGYEATQRQIDVNIVMFEHYMNIKVRYLGEAVDRLTLQLQALGLRTDQQYLNLVTGQVAILDLIAGMMAGTLPGSATLNAPQLDQVRALIDSLVLPLRENLGELTTQVQQLRTDVNTLRTAPAPNDLDARVSTIESFLGVTLAPLLAGLVGVLGANLPTRMAAEEECCATNTGFKNEWADLLNRLKPLLKMLSLLDTAALLALLEHIWSEGLPGFIKEVEGIIDDHLSDVENVVGPFLGL